MVRLKVARDGATESFASSISYGYCCSAAKKVLFSSLSVVNLDLKGLGGTYF